MKDFVSAAACVFGAFPLLLRPGVRRYVLVPLAVNVLLFASAIAWGAATVGDLADRLSARWGWAEWLVWLLWPLFIAVVLLVSFFLFSVIANLLAAPFNGFLAAAVERSLTGRAPEDSGRTLLAELAAGLRAEAIKFRYFLARAIPLLLLFLIPVVHMAAPAVWALFGAWMLALEYLDYPMGNRGLLFPETRAALGRRRGLALGFGAAVLLLTLVPVINFVAMPVAVAAATRLWVEHLGPEAPLRHIA